MSSGAIRVSAVVCTRDRRHYLEKCLAALLQQSAPPEHYEILVVDNGSSDGTRAFLDALETRTTRVRRLFEPEPGLARARNRALARARGEIVAYLDDDAIARTDWIDRILCAFRKGRPRVGVLAGRIEPIWEGERPAWLSDRGLGSLAIVDWTPGPGYLAEGQFLVGANMAFRTELLRAVGGFPEHLGRIGAGLLSGEETRVAESLAERGHRTYYDPRVVVRHHVQRERTERSWLLRRSYWQGVSEVIGWDRDPRGVAAVALGMAGCSARVLYALVRSDPARRFDEYMDAARRLGEISARLGIAPHRPTSDAEPPSTMR